MSVPVSTHELEATPLDDADQALLDEARRTADRLYREAFHEVAAAVRTRGGEVYGGINIRTRMRFADVCGEVAALTAMVSGGADDPETIVAVKREPDGRHELLPPCGRCRELITDFDPETWVIVGTMDAPSKVRAGALLPIKTP